VRGKSGKNGVNEADNHSGRECINGRPVSKDRISDNYCCPIVVNMPIQKMIRFSTGGVTSQCVEVSNQFMMEDVACEHPEAFRVSDVSVVMMGKNTANCVSKSSAKGWKRQARTI
jgi:hypothetical protein